MPLPKPLALRSAPLQIHPPIPVLDLVRSLTSNHTPFQPHDSAFACRNFSRRRPGRAAHAASSAFTAMCRSNGTRRPYQRFKRAQRIRGNGDGRSRAWLAQLTGGEGTLQCSAAARDTARRTIFQVAVTEEPHPDRYDQIADHGNHVGSGCRAVCRDRGGDEKKKDNLFTVSITGQIRWKPVRAKALSSIFSALSIRRRTSWDSLFPCCAIASRTCHEGANEGVPSKAFQSTTFAKTYRASTTTWRRRAGRPRPVTASSCDSRIKSPRSIRPPMSTKRWLRSTRRKTR